MTPDRADLLVDLADRMTRAGDSIPGDWTGFSIVAEITALGVRVTGFRYDGDQPGLPILMDTDAITAIADLRAASPGPAGELFDIYVARLNRETGQILDQAFTAQGGAPYRVTAMTVTPIAELVRPGTPFLAVAAPPEPDPAPEPVPASEPAPEPGPGPESEAQAAAPPVTSPVAPPSAEGLTADLRRWRELRDDDWSGYGAAVAFAPNALYTVGFRYGADGAVPTYVGDSFIRHLHEYRAADARHREHTQQPGAAGAALLRLVDRHQPVQIRMLYPPTSDQISWDAPDSALAQRLAPAATAVTTLAPRTDPDLLDPAALVERITSDVTASLRSRDGWSSFALAYDVAGGRSAGFLYTGDGRSEPYNLPLPPWSDLAELREQTARPDGGQWAGAVLHAWADDGGASHDRVDLSFWGQAGLNSFLLDATSGQGLRMRPPPEPPGRQPALPWPADGGHLDTDRLQSAVSARVRQAADLARDDWDRLAVVVAFTTSKPTVRGLCYPAADGPVAETAIDDAGPIGKLRRSARRTDGRWPDVLVLQGRRGAERLDLTPYFGDDAAALAALPTGPLIDRVRPV